MSSVRALALVLVPLVAAGCGAPSDDTRRPASDPAKVESSAGPSEPVEPGVALEIDDPRIDESSGLARSREHPGVLYTHNDAGNGPDLYAVDPDGTRAVITVEDAEALDWEDMASTRDGRLWIGDIGDREGVRSTISVSVVPEPTPLTTTTVAATTYRFTYPDGPHDAEALLVDPRRFRIYVVTKAPDGAGIYVARKQPLTDRANMLTRVGDAPPNVTGGDFAPAGGSFVLRNYDKAYFYPYLNASPVVVELPEQEQGESITFDSDDHVLVGSEGSGSLVLRLAVPPSP